MKQNYLKHILLCLCLLAGINASAYDAKIDGIYYNFFGDEAIVTSYTSSYPYNNWDEYLGSVIIPETVTYNGVVYSVSGIGDYAFYYCANLTFVTIPEGVKSIGEYAFFSCNRLTSLTIPNSVTNINYHAFDNCYRLTSITIPQSVTSIDSNAFYGCSGLSSISVEEGNTMYDSRDNSNAIIETATNTLIAGCQNTIIPNSVTNIGDAAFAGCYGLLSITIPESVTAIGEDAFRSCGGLKSVTIPNSVITIGSAAFFECTNLTSITIPESVTSIGGSAFSDCYNLTSVIIPKNVTSIGGYVFNRCRGLTFISVEEGNKIYDSRGNCNAIIETASNTLIAGCQSTIIPNSVMSIGNDAFYECSGLVSITIPEGVTSIGDYTFCRCSNLTSIVIPESVKYFGYAAFSNCSSLISITIPKGVMKIGYKAFSGCSGLKVIYCFVEEVPDVYDVTFEGLEVSNVTLYVPINSYQLYKGHPVWGQFNIAIGTGIKTMDNVQSTKYKEIYNLDGRHVPAPQHGLNIIRTNGSTKKVLVK